MKLEELFEKFDELADAPDGLKSMRELVLRLAFSGGLTGKRPTDGGMPDGWENRTLESIAASISPGFACSRSHQADNGHVHLRTHNISTLGTLNFDLLVRIDPKMVDSQKASIREGDILFNNTNSQELVGKTSLVDRDYDYGFSNHITRIRLKEGILPGFVVFYLTLLRNSGYFARLCTRWINQAAINTETLKEQTIPLPPLAEQKRIVAKVDELMSLCDRLEAQQQERETRHAALARSSLARFAEGPTTANLPFLFHPSYAIPPADLRKSILTLAVQGKLVPQDPNDEPAEELYAKLEGERRRFADAHKFRPSAGEPVVDTSAPFAIPSSWKWCRLSSLFNAVTDGDHLPPPKSDDGIAFLTIGNITTGKLDFEGSRFVPDSYYQGLADFRRPIRGDILYTVVGATYGRPALVETDRPFCVQRHIAILKPSQSIDVGFLMTVLRSPLAYDQATASTTGTAQPTIPLGSLRNFAAPLPPLAEQRRIVAKVEQLMALVDALETQLAASRSTAANLLSALVAELTGTEESRSKSSSDRNAQLMKRKATSTLKSRPPAKPSTARRITLRRFAMSSDYRSLAKFDCTYHLDHCDSDETSPICLVGLNGSGKSNLIEAIAEVFCFLELINLPWKKVASTTSRYRQNRHLFEIEYTLEDEHGAQLIRIRKTKKSGADFFTVADDGIETLINSEDERLRVLPRRIIGYSSGLNETVSHPFLRTRTIYSEEVREAAFHESANPARVSDTRTLYMDYESNAAIIISNYIFRPSKELAVIEDFTRVHGVASFRIRFNRKLPDKPAERSKVWLTSELESFLKSFILCAGAQYDQTQASYDLKFTMNPETVRLFRKEFQTAERLFMAMHKWSLLNALVLSEKQRDVYLRTDITKGALERPPSVPPSDRVFNIAELKLKLSSPEIEIDYSGLSDGEHQFIQVFGTALLFSEPGTLFLLDEPESHFNPEWRTKFNSTLNRLPNGNRQEYIISTHSPFIVSGSRQGNVYKFTRTGARVQCEPINFETYGASFDVLLKKLFSIDSLIDESARKDLEDIINRGDPAEMQKAVSDFAESREKRRLYEAIIRKEEEEK